MFVFNNRTLIQLYILVSLLLIIKLDAFKVVNLVDHLERTKADPMGKSDTFPDGKWNVSSKLTIEAPGSNVQQIGNIFIETMQINEQYATTNENTFIIDLKVIFECYYKSALVTVSFVFGIALDMQKVGAILKKPIGPVISAFCNYVFSPLLCLAFAEAVFPDNSMRETIMILFGFGLRGNLSNCWTRILGGNIELSIVMSIINTLLYFITKPFWFDLITTLINSGDADRTIVAVVSNKYYTIWTACCLIVPLLFGLWTQYMFPRTKNYATKLSLFFSVIYIISYTAFMIIFFSVSWIPYGFFNILKSLVAGLLLSILGYSAGWLLAMLFEQKHEDCLAIANETNIPNEEPGSTILPMLIHFIVDKIRNRRI